MDFNTECIHAGYQAGNGQPRTLPIALSTTYPYASCEQVARLFDLSEEGFFYSRIANPTCDAVERKIAALEGGVGALLTSSGQAANLIAVLNVASAGDSIVASSAIYGGTVNLFSVTLRRFGIETRYVGPRATEDEILSAVDGTTKAVFGETVANPALDVLDIETFAAAAHRAGLPLIVDNTFPTPVLCRPMDWGADIVTHSTTKYIDGHAMTVGGVVVDSGRFDWEASGRFPGLTEPDESYHGTVYTRDFGDSAYIVKARVQLMRDLGCYPPATNAFILNETLETLPLRMAQHGSNALAVARWLEGRPEVESVSYPGLESSPDHDLAGKYLPSGCCGVISFVLSGGRERAAALLDALEMVRIEVHVADSQTCALHPASSTHRQLTDDQLAAAGVGPGLVRLSCGLESPEAIISDLEQALAAIA
ncbi:O-acetylhomoserine aminocarboxypropyltransferase/cysteine synthase family protein [Caniella muris]|uniref:O-acetylhomoserine aminocarboxypropyltransferase/cysteine synthase family protein n=1 Tax=Caniella muris TaxID=2941502 RepID=UPI002041D5A4|nr:O-acetylhomoserine aminocarboxypropyltransferase/cysteine synthase family protein [Caniella muris]